MKTNKIIWLIGIIIVLAVTFYFISPNQNTTPADWLTFTDEAGVYTFRYPQDFGRQYVTPVDWPPQVNLLEGTGFNCTEGGMIYGRAGQTVSRTIEGQEYCITTVSEGAAGSIYNQYAYLTVINRQPIGLIFTARLPQCVNYDEPRQDECKADQAAFNPDVIISEIINSLELTH
ncbi:MAG: hypothetical protein KBC48_00790 [Candidatus Pacebacteria bacterium]|nr:hypothetical protein [Candidatus Paceibacterota bacterium]